VNRALVIVAAALALALGAVPVASGAVKFKAPPSGSQYNGHTERGGTVALRIVGRSVESISFKFPCRRVVGNGVLQDIAITKTRRGYRFGISAHGSVGGYSDGRPDENARIGVAGRFSRRAGSVSGWLRVRAPSCPDTGRLSWSAKR
jgi:hypothetical protein